MNTVSIKDIEQYLNDNNIHIDNIHAENKNTVNLHISNGNWRYEHLRCNILISSRYSDNISSYQMLSDREEDNDISCMFRHDEPEVYSGTHLITFKDCAVS